MENGLTKDLAGVFLGMSGPLWTVRKTFLGVETLEPKISEHSRSIFWGVVNSSETFGLTGVL